MKKIRYELLQSIVSDEDGNETVTILEVEMPWSEASEELAKAESHNGEYEVYDDGEPEPAAEVTIKDVLNTLLGVTE